MSKWKVWKTLEWLVWDQNTNRIFLFETGREALEFVNEELKADEDCGV